MQDRRVIQCNLIQGRKVAAAGARAYVVDLNGACSGDVEVLIRNRRGHWVRHWLRPWHLSNFRLKTVPPAHPLYDRLAYADHIAGSIDWLQRVVDEHNGRDS